MSKKLKISVVVSVIFLAACTSSGPINMGQGIYTITKLSAGCGFASYISIKPDLYQEAGEFCAKSGKEIDTISFTGNNGIPMVRCANAELQFRCIKKLEEGTSEYTELQRKQEQRAAQEKAERPKETIIVAPAPVVTPAPQIPQLITPVPAPLPNSTSCTSIRIGDTVNTSCW